MRGRLPLPSFPGQTVGAASPTPRGGLRCRQQQLLPSPLGEGGPAGPDEGQAPAAAPSRVTTRGDSRCRQRPRRGQDPSLRTEPLTGVHVTPRAGHARPLPCGGPETGAHVNPAGVSISPSVGRGAPTPPRPPAAALPRANRRGRRPRRPEEVRAAANNSSRLPPRGKVAPQGRMRGRLPLPPFPGLSPAEACAAANNNPCLPPRGKVAPQGRMRGRLPLPPIPGQPVGGGVPDAPRRLPLPPFPGLPPAETPAAANTRGGVKTPPYGPNH